MRVGPGAAFAAPSEAIAAAAPGDTVLIAPGEYFDCAVVHTNGLTIAGEADGVVLTDKACVGKGLLVIDADDVVVRRLTLTRARVPDENGAGIRAEGTNLTVEHVVFIDNQDGILTNDVPGSTIRITDSRFVRNGRCTHQCAHAIYVGHVALLHIERTQFSDTREGHDVKSRAARTELLDSDVADGVDGTASLLVELPDGGDLLVQGNRFAKGPHTGSTRAAIMLGSEHRGPSDATQIVRDNTLVDASPGTAAFVLNWGAASPVVDNNRVPSGVTALSTRGAWLHAIHDQLFEAKVLFGRVIDLARRLVGKILARA